MDIVNEATDIISHIRDVILMNTVDELILIAIATFNPITNEVITVTLFIRDLYGKHNIPIGITILEETTISNRRYNVYNCNVLLL